VWRIGINSVIFQLLVGKGRTSDNFKNYAVEE
jgi:hypothetical protein